MLISVIKRVFDDKVSSKIVAVNREIMFRVIAYNAYRLSIDYYVRLISTINS